MDLKTLRYLPRMSLPYLVILKFQSGHGIRGNVGRYSPIAFAKKIGSITPGNLTISSNGVNSVKIDCEAYSDANKILEGVQSPVFKLFCATPSLSLFIKRGFIQKVDRDISVQEIYDNMDEASRGITVGLKRRVDFFSKLPTDRVEISFNIAWVPKNIKTFNLVQGHSYYSPPPI